MTREEIKQEAEEQVNVCTPYHAGSFIQGYIAAVESWQAKYEKQKEINKEIVDENEALKFAARMSEKTEKQLRKENEELEEKYKELMDSFNIWKDNLERIKKWSDKRHAKAKDLLERWLKLYNTNTVKGIIADTEKYLKEIKK